MAMKPPRELPYQDEYDRLEAWFKQALGLSAVGHYNVVEHGFVFRGHHDGAKGAQRGVGFAEKSRARGLTYEVGVNLERLEYRGRRPIAIFIHRELADPQLPRLIEQIRRYTPVDQIEVCWWRDAWRSQRSRRPPDYKEHTILRTRLGALDSDEWRDALNDARACLDCSDADAAYGNCDRAWQWITLAEGRRWCQVTPQPPIPVGAVTTRRSRCACMGQRDSHGTRPAGTAVRVRENVLPVTRSWVRPCTSTAIVLTRQSRRSSRDSKPTA